MSMVSSVLRPVIRTTGLVRKMSTLQKEKWDIYTAVCLERTPVIARDLTDLELRFEKLLQEIEYEKSHKSKFELRKEEDKKREKQIREGKVNVTDLDSFPQQTAQDFLDAAKEELKSFTFAPRKDDGTKKEDPKSLERALDRHLLLIVNEKIGQKHTWVLPQGKLKDGETLRESAERVVKEKCGPKINAKFLGNAPSGFYKYRYPKAVRSEQIVGAKIFFHKAVLTDGLVELDKASYNEFSWATRKELNVLPEDYLRAVQMFLIDEEH